MLLGSYPNALCFTYSVVLSPHVRAFDCIFSFSFAVTRTAIRISFIYIIPSFVLFPRGLGDGVPQRVNQPLGADFDWEFGTQSPCLLRCKTHANWRMPSILRDLNREGAASYRSYHCKSFKSSIYLRSWHHILCECHQYCKMVAPLGLVGAIHLGIAITVPSKAGSSDILEAVKKIEYRFFAVVVFFLFGRCLCNGLLHKL